MRQRQITLRFLAEPLDVNFGGKVHGGVVMKWIDQAGYTCAVGWSGHYCVTVYVGGIRFLKPIRIGQLVEVDARVIHTGRSSMHIAVDVSALDVKSGVHKKTTHCVIVFVAVDESGDPIAVPAWEPANDEERRLQQYAMQVADARSRVENELRTAYPASQQPRSE